MASAAPQLVRAEWRLRAVVEFFVGCGGCEGTRPALHWLAALGASVDPSVQVAQARTATYVLPGGTLPVSPEQQDARVHGGVAVRVADVLGPSQAVDTRSEPHSSSRVPRCGSHYGEHAHPRLLRAWRSRPSAAPLGEPGVRRGCAVPTVATDDETSPAPAPPWLWSRAGAPARSQSLSGHCGSLSPTVVTTVARPIKVSVAEVPAPGAGR